MTTSFPWQNTETTDTLHLLNRRIDELEVLLERAQKQQLATEASLRLAQRQLQTEVRQRKQLERALRVLEGREAALLSPKRLQDYGRLLWWLLVRPDLYKEYRIGLSGREEEALQRQTSWLVSSLIWLPLLIWLGAAWSSKILALSLEAGSLLAAGIGIMWWFVGMTGERENALMAFFAVLGTAVMGLVTTAVFVGMTDLQPTNMVFMLQMCVVAFLCALTGVTVAASTRMQIADTIAGLTAVILGGAVILLLSRVSINAFAVIVFVLGAIVSSGFLQERFRKM